MNYPLVVIGAGGFGRETLDIIAALQGEQGAPTLSGVVDDSPSTDNLKLLADRRVEFLGTVNSWLKTDRISEHYVITVGNPQAREKISRKISNLRAAATLIHPDAQVGLQTTFAPGVIVCAGAIISTNVQCGQHTHINPGAIIGHDARLGHYASINPGAVLSGDTSLGNRATLGANCTVLQRMNVGDDATVGAGAVVTRHVDGGTIVVGIPARAIVPD